MGLVSGIQNRLRIITDSRYRHYYIQRSAKDPARRERMAERVAARLPPPLSRQGAEALHESLDTDGYAFVPNYITEQQIADIRAYLDNELCEDQWRRVSGRFRAPDGVPPHLHFAHYDNEQVIRAPHLLQLANDPMVLSAVSNVLGAKPTIAFMALWWSLPTGGVAEDAELWHRDMDDLRFIKLFTYLTEVDESTGPHVFGRGSHKYTGLLEDRRHTDEEVIGALGKENIIYFTGKAGTTFLENTYGFHRGYPPISKPRLAYQVLYSLKPYVGGPKKPLIPLPQMTPSLDPYINRVYCY